MCRVVCSLDVLRHTKGTFQLDAVQSGAFDILVATINRAPVLSEMNPDLSLNVSVDTSQLGIGEVLYQEEPCRHGGAPKIRYIAFTSKSLIGGQKKLSSNQA